MLNFSKPHFEAFRIVWCIVINMISWAAIWRNAKRVDLHSLQYLIGNPQILKRWKQERRKDVGQEKSHFSKQKKSSKLRHLLWWNHQQQTRSYQPGLNGKDEYHTHTTHCTQNSLQQKHSIQIFHFLLFCKALISLSTIIKRVKNTSSQTWQRLLLNTIIQL